MYNRQYTSEWAVKVKAGTYAWWERPKSDRPGHHMFDKETTIAASHIYFDWCPQDVTEVRLHVDDGVLCISPGQIAEIRPVPKR